MAYTVSTIDLEKDKRDTDIWMISWDGGDEIRLTDIKDGVSDYAWSPDGKRLVLVVNDPNPDDDPEKKEGWKQRDHKNFFFCGAGCMTSRPPS